MVKTTELGCSFSFFFFLLVEQAVGESWKLWEKSVAIVLERRCPDCGLAGGFLLAYLAVLANT